MCWWAKIITTRKTAGQVLPNAKYRPTRLVVDAALRRIGKTRDGDNKLQISPVFVNGFKNGFHQWIQRIFLVVVEGKEFVSEFFFVFKIWMHFTAL